MTKIYACLRGALEHLSRSMQEQTELSLLRSVLFGSISLEAQCTHIKSKAAMIMEHKLPTQSVQQIVDINNTDNHADRKKKTFTESTQLHVDTIITTNHAGDYLVRTLKRKLHSNQPVDPVVDSITPSNHPSSNLTNNLERKLPGIESSQPHNKKPTPARAGHAKTAAAYSVGSHQDLSNINLPPPVIYPVMSYVPPQPINVVGHPHMPFDPSGYLARSDPRHPTYANMAYGPHHNPLIYGPRYDPMAPVRLAYGWHGPHYVPNQAYLIFPGPTMLNSTRNHQGAVPSRLFGSNHL